MHVFSSYWLIVGLGFWFPWKGACLFQLMINCWLGILISLSNNPCHFRGSQQSKPPGPKPLADFSSGNENQRIGKRLEGRASDETVQMAPAFLTRWQVRRLLGFFFTAAVPGSRNWFSWFFRLGGKKPWISKEISTPMTFYCNMCMYIYISYIYMHIRLHTRKYVHIIMFTLLNKKEAEHKLKNNQRISTFKWRKSR